MPRKADNGAMTPAEQFQQFRDLLKLPEPRNRRSEHARERRYQAERDLLVAVLSRLFPSHIMPLKGRRIWTEAVCIHTPAGQLAWGLAVDRLEWFTHLERSANDWDGHSAGERFARLRKLLVLLDTVTPAKSEGKIRKSEGNSGRRRAPRTQGHRR